MLHPSMAVSEDAAFGLVHPTTLHCTTCRLLQQKILLRLTLDMQRLLMRLAACVMDECVMYSVTVCAVLLDTD